VQIPTWLGLVAWFGSVLVVALVWLWAQLKFRRIHQARRGGYRTSDERWQLFLEDPGRFAREEPTDWTVRLQSNFAIDADPEVERLRRRALALYVVLLAVAFGGWALGFLLVGALRAMADGYVIPVGIQLAILVFWMVLLGDAINRANRSRVSLLILLAAVGVSIAVLFATVWLTRP
jgi:hypothetical protein